MTDGSSGRYDREAADRFGGREQATIDHQEGVRMRREDFRDYHCSEAFVRAYNDTYDQLARSQPQETP